MILACLFVQKIMLLRSPWPAFAFVLPMAGRHTDSCTLVAMVQWVLIGWESSTKTSHP